MVFRKLCYSMSVKCPSPEINITTPLYLNQQSSSSIKSWEKLKLYSDAFFNCRPNENFPETRLWPSSSLSQLNTSGTLAKLWINFFIGSKLS